MWDAIILIVNVQYIGASTWSPYWFMIGSYMTCWVDNQFHVDVERVIHHMFIWIWTQHISRYMKFETLHALPSSQSFSIMMLLTINCWIAPKDFISNIAMFLIPWNCWSNLQIINLLIPWLFLFLCPFLDEIKRLMLFKLDHIASCIKSIFIIEYEIALVC